MTRPRGFAGRTAIVTGGASGIGRALGHELAAAGARVVLADVDEAGLGQATAAIEAEGPPGSVASVVLDVRDGEAFTRVADEVRREHGAVDLLFNNAGVGLGGPTHELTSAHWERVLDVNLRGVLNGVLAVYPGMVARGDGHIVNTASLAGLVPTPLVVPYATSKHAVVGLSTSLRVEAALAGVRVSVLCPGGVETPILDRRTPEDLPTPSLDLTAREFFQRSGMRMPLLEPRELAREALRQVARDRAVIVVPGAARTAWWLQRLVPGLLAAGSRISVRRVLASGRRRAR